MKCIGDFFNISNRFVICPERLEVEVVGLRTYQQRTEADIYTLKRNSEVLVHTASKIA